MYKDTIIKNKKIKIFFFNSNMVTVVHLL